MEWLAVAVCLAATAGSLSCNLLAAALLWRLVRAERTLPWQETEESPGEAARRRYEQGFLNLMNYDGSPRRKEEDGQ